MSRFHSLKIKEVRKETPECVSVHFDLPEERKADFVFLPGQYLTLKTVIDGEEVRRSYSICSSPLDNELTVAIKSIPEGVFSQYANSTLKAGDLLEVMPPLGRFTVELSPENEKHYFFIAVGSGITPVLSLVKTILKTEAKSTVTILYGNKDKGSIIFKEQIEALKNKFMKRLTVHFVLSQDKTDAEILNGRIDKQKLDKYLNILVDPATISEAFLCGPEEMLMMAKDTLIAAGVPEKNVHFELFTTAGAQAVARNKTTVINSDGPAGKVTIKLDGLESEIAVPFQGETILDVALRKGADLPFACKGGVCCACRAKVEEGEVTMDVNYGLEKDEVEAGFILTCQAHPVSERVVINFDIK